MRVRQGVRDRVVILFGYPFAGRREIVLGLIGNLRSRSP